MACVNRVEELTNGWRPDDFEPERDADGEVISSFDAGVLAAVEVSESALLDRIERKVRLQGLVDPDSTDAWSNGWEAALDAVLAVLTEIRRGR